jgi:hypothetical protein
MKAILKKRHPAIIFGYLLDWCIEIWQIFLNSGQILTIENLKKHINFSTSNFQYRFLAIFRQPKKKGGWGYIHLSIHL